MVRTGKLEAEDLLCAWSIGSNRCNIQVTNQTNHAQESCFLDSGCTREIVGRDFAIARKLKLRRLEKPGIGRLMDGTTLVRITHETWQTISVPGTNGWKKYYVNFLVMPSDEGFVLGHRWLTKANPIIDWKNNTVTWRKTLLSGPQIDARKTKIQSKIPANDPPEWVKRQYGKVFDNRLAEDKLPRSRGELDYEFVLREHRPWAEKPRHYKPHDRAVIEEWIQKELKGGRWIPSKSPYRSQLHVADNDRVCCDYRPVNKHMVGDQWPIPNLKELMNTVAKAKYISSLDMPKGYNQVLNKEHIRQYLAVEVNGRLYEPMVMQFGSKTAVSWFQRIVCELLAEHLDRGIKVYLDNIIIYADTQEEHDRLLAWTLEQLIKEGFPLSPTKCEWSKPEALVGGFFVGSGRIRVDPEKVKAIVEWPEPTDHSKGALATWSRKFIGFINYIKEDIAGMSDIAAPLTDMQRNDSKQGWDDAAKTSFQALKALAAAAPILAAIDHRLPLRVYTDASDKGVGAHYTQTYPGCGHEVTLGFFSRKLNPAQQRYHTTERELMAIVYALEHIRSWILNNPYRPTVLTDHKALVKFMEKKKWNSRLDRWGATLLEFMPQIEFIPGKSNIAADALSRQWGGEKDSYETAILHDMMITPTEMRRVILEAGDPAAIMPLDEGKR